MSGYYGADGIPAISPAEAGELDRMVAQDLALQPMQLAENAGRNVAHLARIRFCGGDPRDHRIVVLVGAGFHGATAIVASRRLAAWGADVVTYLMLGDEGYSGLMRRQVDALPQFGVAAQHVDMLLIEREPELVIDGIFGASHAVDAPEAARSMIEWVVEQRSPVLSIDVPAGVDPATGLIGDPAVVASATLALGLPKTGVRSDGVEGYVGELYVADLGIPAWIYAQPPLGIDVGQVFARGDVVRIQ